MLIAEEQFKIDAVIAKSLVFCSISKICYIYCIPKHNKCCKISPHSLTGITESKTKKYHLKAQHVNRQTPTCRYLEFVRHKWPVVSVDFVLWCRIFSWWLQSSGPNKQNRRWCPWEQQLYGLPSEISLSNSGFYHHCHQHLQFTKTTNNIDAWFILSSDLAYKKTNIRVWMTKTILHLALCVTVSVWIWWNTCD